MASKARPGAEAPYLEAPRVGGALRTAVCLAGALPLAACLPPLDGVLLLVPPLATRLPPLAGALALAPLLTFAFVFTFASRFCACTAAFRWSLEADCAAKTAVYATAAHSPDHRR